MCYCLCCASFQGPQKALGSCCVCCCRNTQEGAPHMTPLLPSQILSVEGKLFLQTSPNSSIKCELPQLPFSTCFPTAVLLCRAFAVQCFSPSPALGPHSAKKTGLTLLVSWLVGISWCRGSWAEVMGLSCSWRWNPHSKSSHAVASPFVLVTWTFLRHVHQFLLCLHQGREHFSSLFSVPLKVTFKLNYLLLKHIYIPLFSVFFLRVWKDNSNYKSNTSNNKSNISHQRLLKFSSKYLHHKIILNGAIPHF